MLLLHSGVVWFPIQMRTLIVWLSYLLKRLNLRLLGEPRQRWCRQWINRCSDPERETDPVKKESLIRALKYMGLQPNDPITSIKLDRVFIGSCTNSRIEDLRAAAEVVKGRKVASTVKQAMVVPGSGLVKAQAEVEGLDKIFIEAGFEWREPGCSMCLAMNPDKLGSGEHCASTSNRNFEGRQGIGGRTHLVSPAMAAAAAVAGHFVDVREMMR